MKKEFFKEIEGEKRVYKTQDVNGNPGREVDTAEWEIHDYIVYCLYPLENCLHRMQGMEIESDSEISEFVDILDRLYDSARVQLQKMEEAIYKDMGWIQIVTTNEKCRGGFMEQDFLEVYVKKEPNKKAVNA